MTVLKEEIPPTPRALKEGRWNQIDEDLKQEALDRTAFLTFRGVLPAKALEEALKGMNEDLTQLEYEPAWSVVRNLARNWPGIYRSPSGHYRFALMMLASSIESAARAEATEPGAVPRPVAVSMGFQLPHPDFAVAADAVFDARVAELIRMEELAAQQALLQCDNEDPWDEE